MTDERPWSVLGDREDWETRDEQADWDQEIATRRRERRMLLWLILVVALVAGAIYAVGYVWTRDRLPRGTTVAGVEVGGMNPLRAQAELAAGLKDRIQRPIRLEIADEEFEVDPRSAGLDVDIPASIAQVPVGRSANPADMWESVVGGEDYPAVVVTIDDKLQARLQRIADQVHADVTDGAVDFTADGARPVYPSVGEDLDVESAAAVVAGSFLTSGDPLVLTLDTVEPTVPARAVSQAMRRVANPATSAPVVYRFGSGREVVVRPDELPGVLSLRAQGSRLVPHLDAKAFARLVDPQVARIEREPQDALVLTRADGKLRVEPAVAGRAVNVRSMVDTFLTLARADGDGRTVFMRVRTVEPEVSTAQAERQRERLREQRRDDRRDQRAEESPTSGRN